jgi:hypothetical protein
MPGLYYAFGFCGHGFQLAPGAGLVMSELLADGATQPPLEPFAITRFASAGQVAANSLAHEFDSSLVPPRSYRAGSACRRARSSTMDS